MITFNFFANKEKPVAVNVVFQEQITFMVFKTLPFSVLMMATAFTRLNTRYLAHQTRESLE
jgi:hypothetical protein